MATDHETKIQSSKIVSAAEFAARRRDKALTRARLRLSSAFTVTDVSYEGGPSDPNAEVESAPQSEDKEGSWKPPQAWLKDLPKGSRVTRVIVPKLNKEDN
jgi:hypothetical protein